MALSISDLTPEGRRYFEQLQKLSRLEVQVGFQEGQTYEDGTSLADVAAYNELGTSDSPARPFMRQSFENHEPELKAACEQVNKTLAEGGTTEKALKDLGVFYAVQQEILGTPVQRAAEHSRLHHRRPRGLCCQSAYPPDGFGCDACAA